MSHPRRILPRLRSLARRRDPARLALVAAAAAISALTGAASSANAQLRADQVLVVYHSGIPVSQQVATYYQSRRPGVRLLDLATQGVAAPGAPGTAGTPDISYSDFIVLLRSPIRQYLTQTGLARQVRSIVLTKGLPHRIQQIGDPTVGDNPGVAGDALNGGTYSAASVDSELSLLYSDLVLRNSATGALNNRFANGFILNPLARTANPVMAFSNRNILQSKTYTNVYSTPGVAFTTAAGSASSSLTIGDVYLVCRLDGNSLLAVQQIIDRALLTRVDVASATIILDESNSNGIADAAANAELDNQGPPETRPAGADGDDYEAAANALTNDRRFLSTPQTPPPPGTTGTVRYNNLSGPANFIVGPVNPATGIVSNPPASPFGGVGILVTNPVVLLASEGANHGGGFPPGAGDQFPLSFVYSPAAIYNTIESANGRKFGGLGPNFGQSSLSDFLQAGGTLGLGYVWEPFTFTISDNLYLTRNFLLGNLSWAEAAYTSMPALSFQTIVLGDPLARVVRSSEDPTNDARTNIDDLHAYALAPYDINRDSLINTADRQIIERSVRGFEAVFSAGEQRR